MSKSVIPFTNDAFGEIRGMMIDGVPYFVGKDVATALGYSNFRDALARHVRDKHKKDGVVIRDSIGRNQKPTLISEAGLYALIMRSNLPKAEDFQDWVVEEVLPAIRKTGAYVLSKAEKELLEARRDSKLYRHEETDAIKLFIEYARLQGCDWDEKYIYSQITIMCNLAVGLPMKGGRNFATKIQLKAIAVLEGLTVKNTLLSGIAQGLDWKEIWAQIRLQIIAFQEVNFPAESNIPLIGG
ncbi:MAG: hypothetical protein IJQ16_03240 [Selenomonadaceae bacterium]|nr:hypothetical protein [Selenomonadaceae bacterium]